MKLNGMYFGTSELYNLIRSVFLLFGEDNMLTIEDSQRSGKFANQSA